MPDGSVCRSPPCPFFSTDGEVDRVGRVRRVKVVQIRLIEHVLSGLRPGIENVIIRGSRHKGSSRRKGNEAVDESHDEQCTVLGW